MTPPPSSSPLVEKVSRAMAAADGYVSLSRAGNAYYDSLALAAVRVVVEHCAELADYMEGDDCEDGFSADHRISKAVRRLLPSEPEA